MSGIMEALEKFFKGKGTIANTSGSSLIVLGEDRKGVLPSGFRTKGFDADALVLEPRLGVIHIGAHTEWPDINACIKVSGHTYTGVGRGTSGEIFLLYKHVGLLSIASERWVRRHVSQITSYASTAEIPEWSNMPIQRMDQTEIDAINEYRGFRGSRRQVPDRLFD